MRTKNVIYDKIVGNRIRYYRTLKGMSQEKLGEVLGVTFQQIQKYESGKNTLNVSKIREIVDALGCGVEDIMPPLNNVDDIDRRLDIESTRLLQRVMQLDKPARQAVIRFATTLAEYRSAVLSEVANA